MRVQDRFGCEDYLLDLALVLKIRLGSDNLYDGVG